MIKRGLTLDNALNITPRISTNDAAGPEAAGPKTGGTTALVRTPVLPFTRGCRRALERHGPRRAAVVVVTNRRLAFGTWERIFSGQP